MNRVSGEDWMVTDEIKDLAKKVVLEVRRRGGMAASFENRIACDNFPLSRDRMIPNIGIKLYEGSYHEGEVIITAEFGEGRQYPLPIGKRVKFDARAVVDAVAKSFMSLVNYRNKTVESAVKEFRASLKYPNTQQVEHANLHQLVYWWRYLPGPGLEAVGQDNFNKLLEVEAKIMERIGERIKELGGITPSVSKAVGLDRRSSVKDIPPDVMNKFYGLANSLSPENLFCDGECSHSEAMAKQRQIMNEWAKLERRIGRKVTVDEVEDERRYSYQRNPKRLAIDFPTKEALDKYLKDHPKADRANHKVVETKKEKPWFGEKAEWEPPKSTDGYNEPDPDDPDEMEPRDYAKELKKYDKGPVIDPKLFKNKEVMSQMMWSASNGKDSMDLLKGALDGGHPIPKKLLDEAIESAGKMLGGGTTYRILKKIRDRSEDGGKIIPLVQPDKRQVASESFNLKVASGLLVVAKSLVSMDFPTQEALDKYLKDHPDANRSNHKVRKNVWDSMTPAQKSRAQSDDRKDDRNKAENNWSKENYPDWRTIEKADLKSLKEWDEGLDEPGSGSKGTSDYRDDLADEKDKQDRIRKRMKDLEKK
jgi:hypothetical protein